MLIPCLRCKRFYRCKHVGHAFEEGMPTKSVGAGVHDGAGWQPYKLWIGDLYECEGCGAQTIVGMAGHPLAEHYQEDYGLRADRYRTQIGGLVRVDDCPGSFSQHRADQLRPVYLAEVQSEIDAGRNPFTTPQREGRPGYCGRCGCQELTHGPHTKHAFIQETGTDLHENDITNPRAPSGMWPDLSAEINTPSAGSVAVDAELMRQRRERREARARGAHWDHAYEDLDE